MKYKRIMEVLDAVSPCKSTNPFKVRKNEINELLSNMNYMAHMIGYLHDDFYLGFDGAINIVKTLLIVAHEEDKKNGKRKMVEVDKVIQAVDRHTKEDGGLDEDISVILEEAI